MKEAGIKKARGGAVGKEEVLKSINNEYENPYKYFLTRYTDDEGKLRYSFEKLYERVISKEAIEDMTFSNDAEKAAYSKLTEWGIRGAASLYAFLSIDEPYYMRNYYIHGSETPLLVSDAYHLELLSCLNYFMDKLLVTYIPALFDDAQRKNLIDKVHGIIYTTQQQINKELVNKVNKMAKELGQQDHLWMMGKEFPKDKKGS